MKNNELIIWGDNWWVEKDNVWFVWGMQNIICCLDLKTMICELVVNIPNKLQQKFRANPFCIKYQDDLYCMPIYGESIWIYNTISRELYEIFIDNQDKKLLNIRDFWKFDNKIYVVSNGLGQIIEISPKDKKIINYYQLSKKYSVTKSIKVDSVIYCLFEEIGEVYQFDLITKRIVKYKLPDIGRKFNTICFDGKKFWLSGYHKEIYVWDQKKNEISILDKFPRGFGMYDFTRETDGKVDITTEKFEKFTCLFSVVIGQKVWFISYHANKILYVDQVTNQIEAFEIEEENETKESLLVKNRLGCKYLLDYVKDSRYIGLFSVKNECILEIDTIEMKYKYKYYNYHINDRCVEECANFCNFTFNELNVWEREIYKRVLYLRNNDTHNVNVNCIGTEVYKRI